MTQEEILWRGSPSQVKNLTVFLFCLLTSWLIIPIFFAIWRWLEVKCFQYEVTSERIRIMQGVLSRRTDELELYRVKDITFVQPFFLRLFALGNIVLNTSDKTTPIIVIECIPQAEALREKMRLHIERLRDEKQVRQIDFDRIT